jgi:hypothetical protein
MVVAEFIGPIGTTDAGAMIARFWEAVETNLRAGKIRLLFAADEIPPELSRIVEFLNEQMNPAEVVAIEIRQYVGTGVRTLVPSVIRSSKRTTTAGDRPSVQWDRKSFIEALLERRGSQAVSVCYRYFGLDTNALPNDLVGGRVGEMVRVLLASHMAM